MAPKPRKPLTDQEVAVVDTAVSTYVDEVEQARLRLRRHFHEARNAYRQDQLKARLQRDATLLALAEAGPRGTQLRIAEHIGSRPVHLSRRFREVREAMAAGKDVALTP